MKKSEFIEEYIRRVKAYRNAPSYREHPFEVSDEGCRDLALNAAEQAEEAGVEWDPEEPDLRPCPNPECSDPGALRVQWSNLSGRVVCDGCSMEGPAAPLEGTPRRIVEAEAIRRWNLLPRTQDEVPGGGLGERELPERVGLGTLNAAGFSAAMLKWERLGPKETMGWDEPEDRRVYREAASCYNAVRRWQRGQPGHKNTIFGAILSDERGKLR